jgi:hypothetical protein
MLADVAILHGLLFTPAFPYRPLELFKAHMGAALRVVGGAHQGVDQALVICAEGLKVKLVKLVKNDVETEMDPTHSP